MPKKPKTPEPWERQEIENARQFHAFTLYRDQLPSQRSLRSIAASLGHKTMAMVSRWSKDKGWVKRVAAWDDEQDRIKRLAHKEEITRVTKRQLKVASAFISKSIETLSQQDQSKLTTTQALKAFEIASRIEREILGIPTIVQVQGDEEKPVGVRFVRAVKPDARKPDRDTTQDDSPDSE